MNVAEARLLLRKPSVLRLYHCPLTTNISSVFLFCHLLNSNRNQKICYFCLLLYIHFKSPLGLLNIFHWILSLLALLITNIYQSTILLLQQILFKIEAYYRHLRATNSNTLGTHHVLPTSWEAFVIITLFESPVNSWIIFYWRKLFIINFNSYMQLPPLSTRTQGSKWEIFVCASQFVL